MSITFGCQRQSLLKYWAKFCKGFSCQDWELSSSKWSIKLSDVIIRVILVAIAQFQIIIDCCPSFTSLCGCLGTCAFPLSTNQMPTSRPIRFTTKTNHKFLTRSVAFSRVWGGKPAFTLGSSVLTPLMFFLALLAIAIALVRFMTLTQESVWKTLSWCRILCEKLFGMFIAKT